MTGEPDKTTGDRRFEPEQTEQPEDEVDEAGEESFPASDPPAWTAAVGSGVWEPFLADRG